MEKYKKTIIIRIILLSILAFIGVGLGLLDVFWAQERLNNTVLFCFQCGFSVAMGLTAIIWVIRYSAIMRDMNKLQLQFNKENDERMKTIKAKAGLPVVLILSIILILAGMVVGYFNVTLFYCLIAVASGQLLISLIIKFIYMRVL